MHTPQSADVGLTAHLHLGIGPPGHLHYHVADVAVTSKRVERDVVERRDADSIFLCSASQITTMWWSHAITRLYQ